MLQRAPKPEPPTRQAELRRARDRRHRDRVKAGKIVVGVELGAAELDWLVRIRWLTEAEADAGDARIIGQAVAHGLAASAKG